MPEQCPSCKTISLDKDEFECQTHWVCTECGYVDQERSVVLDTSSATKDGTSEVAHNHITGSRNNPGNIPFFLLRGNTQPKGKRYAVKQVKLICNLLKFTPAKTSEAVSLFEKAFYLDIFKFSRIEKKMVLAACCVYTICRQNDYPVTNEYFAKLAGCPLHEYCCVKSRLHSGLGIKITSADVTEIVDTMCKDAGLEHLSNDTLQCVKLLESVGQACGKKPQTVVYACLFLVWKSEDFTARKKTSLNKFCKLINVQTTQACKERVGELTDLLHTLCAKIPWVTRVTKATVCLYIQDIFKYQNSLLFDCYSELRAAQEQDLDDYDDELQEPDQERQAQEGFENNDIEVLETKCKGHCDENRRKARQMELQKALLPRAFIKSEKSSTECDTPKLQIWHNLDDCEVTENDLPAEDLNQYIRSESEICELQQLELAHLNKMNKFR